VQGVPSQKLTWPCGMGEEPISTVAFSVTTVPEVVAVIGFPAAVTVKEVVEATLTTETDWLTVVAAG